MFEVGVTLGERYLLVALVARGGMGEVWSAKDVVLDRRVAVKVLLPSLAGDPGFAARFLAEARAMAALSHPGIVEIYDYGQAGELAYLVMQFVEGESLVSLIRRSGPLAPEAAMRLIVQAAEAIEAAHRQGIVHRDVKPANLLLRADGRLALTDFGIARILATDRLTVGEQIVGTSSYLAPEQVTGHEIGPATDVYALGVVAYELLTGVRPFDADTPFGVALKHVHEQPPPLPDSIAQPIREVVLRAMAKQPHARWPGAAALAQAAAAAIGQTVPTFALPITTTAAADAATVQELTGPTTRGPAPAAAAPVAAGPLAASSLAAGPVAAVPLAAVPVAAGPLAAGPLAAGPVAAGAVADVPGRGRLLVLGAGTFAVAVAVALAVVLSPDTVGERQSRTPGASLSPTAIAESTPAPVASTASPAVSTRPATSTAATSPAGPTATSAAPATATMPNLYGWRESEVRSEMTRLGLVPRITYRATPDKCYAIEQTPPGGTVLPAGSAVDIVIATATGTCKQV